MNIFKRGLMFLTNRGFFNLMPDEMYLKMRYKCLMGEKLNLDNPVKFNEKIQWLKLYDRNPKYTMMADKYAVREYIKETIGEEYLIPLIGVWDRVEDIDFDSLPEQFVLKCNHNSGLGMCICKDKSTLDIENVKKELQKGLNQNYFLRGREWCYKDIKRKIIAEKYMTDFSHDSLIDYKFMCFNGKCLYTFVYSDRFSDSGVRMSVYDRDWKRMPFRYNYLPAKNEIPKPSLHKEMIEIAETLSKDIPFARVDLYEINKKIYFSELTFYPANGMGGFHPEEWNYKLGNQIELPQIK